MARHSCAECGAVHEVGKTCEDDFHQMLFWEAEDPARVVVHHLMVLCCHVQHPSLYSPDGLRLGLDLLAQFVDEGVAPQEVRHRNRQNVASKKRAFKITGTPQAQGAYDRAVGWTMTAATVTVGGGENYVENVRHWAQSMRDALNSSGATPKR